jgi:fatty acid desaturase
MSEAIPANPRPITWYRSPLEKADFKSLHEKSDFLGALQTLGFLGLLVTTTSLALYSANHWPLGVTALLVILHGTLCAFFINAVHELGHNTVFKTKALNSFFVRFFSFFGWINFEMFNTSHTRHHRYTLHQPDDLEVTLPAKIILRHALVYGIINPKSVYWTIRDTIRIARAQFSGEWHLKLFPEGSPERAAAVNWARFLLAGHAFIIVVSCYFHLWLLPLLTTFNMTYGGWLQFLCNNTQHIGLQDDVSDFRLCCRTFTINPVLQFLYWHMNFHIEHHMFAAVPCYKLGRLHRLIKHDLAPCPHGLVATWKEIDTILKAQETDPHYQYVAPVPNPQRADSVLTAAPAV